MAIILLIVAVFGFEPLTRSVSASQFVCLGCHLDGEYDPRAERPVSKSHADRLIDKPARCVDCHVSKGAVGALFVYTHIFSHTDLYGDWQSLPGERTDPVHPPNARKAYRVRDAMRAADSRTCRDCHTEENSRPRTNKGLDEHKRGLEKKQTCIDCHFNLVHREVPPREQPPGDGNAVSAVEGE